MSKTRLKKENLNNLIINSQNGNIKALEELIKRVQKHIYSIFSHLTQKKEDISDLTQETLLKMAKSISQLKNPIFFNAWLNKIITNIYYDYSRKNPDKFIELSEEKFNEIKDKIGCEPGEKCLFAELDKLIKTALMTLSKDLRITIVLREYEGLSYQDISEITNTAIGTVKSRLSRARIKLQKELKEFI